MNELTNEEVLLKEYKLLSTTVKAHKELILPEEKLIITLENNEANRSIIQRLTNSFELRQRETTSLHDVFQLDTCLYKRFLTLYALTLVKDINTLLQQTVPSLEAHLK